MRDSEPPSQHIHTVEFPFLFGGTFIEGLSGVVVEALKSEFPFLFGGTFIEGRKHP